MKKIILISITILTFCSQLSFAESVSLKNGFEAYSNKDYDRAKLIFEAFAADGTAHAQYALGFLYDEGAGVKKDDEKAFSWYKKAALQGHASAQFQIGEAYLRKKGVKENLKEAVIWYKKSEAQGDKDAKLRLNQLFLPNETLFKITHHEESTYHGQCTKGNKFSASFFIGSYSAALNGSLDMESGKTLSEAINKVCNL